ncbi:hypothetical protein, partial [Escherichia coli]|uniref:hypothetical protein n=1 Tax=Escherichia coli TaxID=562 RepID=UPI001BC89F30
GGTADRNRSHWSTSKTPSYTKSVSWQHHLVSFIDKIEIININNELAEASTVISYSLVDLCKTDQYYR